MNRRFAELSVRRLQKYGFKKSRPANGAAFLPGFI
jgi:hypothetical protein